MYGFLLSRRWLGFAAVVLLLLAICVRAGMWQMDKHDARVADNRVARANLVADPRPLEDVVPPGGAVAPADEWATVRAQGVYDVENEIIVRFSTRDGAPGVDVVTPLLLDDGSAVLVDRGWIQTLNNGERPDVVPAPPSGEVEVVGWVRPDSGARDEAVTPVDQQVRAINSEAVGSSLGLDLRPGYVNLQEQTGGTDALATEPLPDLGQGPHFFYAFQWWFFGLLALVGYFWFAWSEARDRREGRVQGQRRPSAPTSRVRRG